MSYRGDGGVLGQGVGAAKSVYSSRYKSLGSGATLKEEPCQTCKFSRKLHVHIDQH
jgi:hypothetical protein